MFRDVGKDKNSGSLIPVNLETVVWIQSGVIIVLVGITVFLINKTWDKTDKEKETSDSDLGEVRAKTEKNEEHISKFRGELGLLNNEIINKIGAINTLQQRIERDVDSLRTEYRELDRFLRSHFVGQGRKGS